MRISRFYGGTVKNCCQNDYYFCTWDFCCVSVLLRYLYILDFQAIRLFIVIFHSNRKSLNFNLRLLPQHEALVFVCQIFALLQV